MKKVYINENHLSSVVKDELLPQFLFKLVKTHSTSLGDSEAFPSGGKYPFDYTVLKERYLEVLKKIKALGLESLDEDYLMSELSSLITRCRELERPVRDSLEKICENAVNRLFAIPEEMIIMKLSLVDKIEYKNYVRVNPEYETVGYTFKDVADIDHSNKAVDKRRFIDSLIQGASYLYANDIGLYVNEIDTINGELLRLYRKIRIINDYLLFTKKEKITDDNPMQGSYVETHLGVNGKKTKIKAQGLIFPLLLQETIRGMFELFSSHGLPDDISKASYIIKMADFVLAEPWDMRLGVGLWKRLFGSIEDTNLIPYVFTSLVKLPADKFNSCVKEILSKTEKGSRIMQQLVTAAEYDNGYQQFTNRINARNINKSVINDSYFTGAENGDFTLDSDDDNNVIEEDDN